MSGIRISQASCYVYKEQITTFVYIFTISMNISQVWRISIFLFCTSNYKLFEKLHLPEMFSFPWLSWLSVNKKWEMEHKKILFSIKNIKHLPHSSVKINNCTISKRVLVLQTKGTQYIIYICIFNWILKLFSALVVCIIQKGNIVRR